MMFLMTILLSLNFVDIYSQLQTTPEPIESLFSEVFGTPENVTSALVSERTPEGLAVAVEGEKCECVPLIQCYDYNNTLTTGEGIIDIRFGKCPDSLAVCCRLPGEVPETPILPAYTHAAGKCGKRNSNGVGFRIVTPNKEAQFGEFPWMIGILKLEHGAPQYTCGGSLIHSRVVLTAAHCVKGIDPKRIIARAGEWDSQSINEILPYQERDVQNIIIHKNFVPSAVHNDIALLILNEPFEFAENVDTVCLAEDNNMINGSGCVASGWGKDKFGKDGVYQNKMKKVTLPLVERQSCITQLRNTRLGHMFQLHESFICAGGKEGEDTCEGDGGGPLMCQIIGARDRFQQVGIVAWGIGCGNTIPAVYVHVSYFKQWIDDQMRRHMLSTTDYTYQP